MLLNLVAHAMKYFLSSLAIDVPGRRYTLIPVKMSARGLNKPTKQGSFSHQKY